MSTDPTPETDRLDDLRAEYANTGAVTSDGAVWLFSQIVVLREQVERLRAATAPAAGGVVSAAPDRADDEDRIDRLAQWLWDNCAEDERTGLLADDPRRIAAMALRWPELRRVADEREAADAYDRALRTPPSAEACAALRERLASGQVARRKVRRRVADEAQQQPDTETVAEAEAERLATLTDCPNSRNGGLHCDHYQQGDGPCCHCQRPNWCPEGGVA